MNNFKTSKKLLALLLAIIMTFSGISVYAAESVGTDEDYGISLAHDHFYSNWEITKQPTCKTSGIKTRKCLFEGCGKTETVTVDPVVNAHVPGTETVIRAVTCTTNGISEFVCSSCGEEYRVETEKLGHVFPKDSNGKEIWTVTVEPVHIKMYNKNGLARSSCTRCNLNIDKVLPVEHDFDGVEPTIAQPSTCSTEGYQEILCNICRYSVSETLPLDPKSHTFSGKIKVTSEVFNCMTDGEGIVVCEECNQYEKVKVSKDTAHDYIEWQEVSGAELPDDATCSNGLRGEEARFCIDCKTTLEKRYIYADHNFKTYDENGEPTSTVKFVLEPTCTERGYCIGDCVDCGKTNVKNYLPIDKNAHDYIDYVEQAATCSSEGTLLRMCRNDGRHIGKVAIEKIDHIYSDAWEIKEATCLEDGYKRNHCAACNDTIEIELPKSEAPHMLDGQKWTVTKASDCVTDEDPKCGEESAACKLCRKIVTRELPLCYSGSKYYAEGSTAPTCYKDGEDVYICMKCGTTVSITIPKDETAHTPSSDYALGKDSTCSEVGYMTKYCLFCNADIEENQKLIPLKDHVIVEEYESYPTCAPDPADFKTGIKYHKCTECTYVSEPITITAEHNFSTWSEAANASCLAPVKRERVCYNCHLIEVDNLYYGPHTEGNWTFVSGSCKVGGIAVKTCRTCNQDYDTKVVKEGEHADLVLVNNQLVPSEDVCYGNEYKCNTCNGTVIVTKSHNYIVLEHGSAPTCELPGMSESKYCAKCKYQVEQTVLAPLGHSFYYDSEGTKACSVCKRYFVEGALQESCKHFCHNNGMIAKVMKIVFGFFWKTFGSKHFCECGTPHYHEDAVTIVSTEYDDEGNLKKLEYSCSECKGLTKTKTIKF